MSRPATREELGALARRYLNQLVIAPGYVAVVVTDAEGAFVGWSALTHGEDDTVALLQAAAFGADPKCHAEIIPASGNGETP